MALQEAIKSIVLVKSGALPTATEVVAVKNVPIISPKIKTGTVNEIGTGALGNAKGYVDGSDVSAEFSLATTVKSPISLGVACELANLFKLAGLAETLTVGTSCVYKLGGISSSGTGQIKTHMDGFSRTITDASSSLKISGKIGEPLEANFDVKGITTAAATAVANPAVTLNAGNGIVLTKATTTLTVAGAALSMKEFEFDLGATLQRSYTSNTNEWYIENFKPTLTVTCVKTKTTDEAAWTAYAAGGTSVINLTIGAAGNQFMLDASSAFTDSIDESDDVGRVVLKRTYTLQNGGTANNNFTITLK